MSEKSLIPVETKQKLEKALEFFNSLKEIKFTTDQEYENGVELCRNVKGHIKIVDDDRKSLVKPYNDKVSEINGECNNVIRKLQNAENVIKKGMSEFFRVKELKRIEEQRRLEAEAEERRLQEEERARKEREKAEEYRDKGRESMAAKAEARAETSEAIASSLVAPIVQNSAKAVGTSFTKKYYVKVIDMKKAILACMENDILFQYISMDTKGIEKLANAQKGKLLIDGIQIVEDYQVGMRLK